MPVLNMAYPLKPPPFGDLAEIVPGIFWTRVPLPFALDHLNVWILDEGDAWTVVDCGMDTPDTLELWKKLLSGPLQGKPVRLLIATHGHGDHIGFARHFCALTGASFLITRGEWFSAMLRRSRSLDAIRAEAALFYGSNGFPLEDVEPVLKQRETMAEIVAPPPESYLRIRNGQTLRSGRHDWLVSTSGGHAPEHPIFHAAAQSLLIAGDQLLPRISPHIGVQMYEPEEDPLGEYLELLANLQNTADGVLVLPSHEAPYTGLAQRVDQLQRHHAARLNEIVEATREPRNAFQITAIVFERAVRRGQGHHAFTETLSHLNYLHVRGRLLRETGSDGTIVYTSADHKREEAVAMGARKSQCLRPVS